MSNVLSTSKRLPLETSEYMCWADKTPMLPRVPYQK